MWCERKTRLSARGGQVDFRTQLFIQPGDEMQMADMADFCLYYILICISYRVIIVRHARMQIYSTGHCEKQSDNEM